MRVQFRVLVLVAMALHAIPIFVLPKFPSLFSADTMELIGYRGHGARVNPTHPIVYVFFLLPFPALIATYFFKNWGRYLFLFFLIVTSLGTFVLGTSISGPPETFIGYSGTLIDGAVIALAFLAPVKAYFSKSNNGP